MEVSVNRADINVNNVEKFGDTCVVSNVGRSAKEADNRVDSRIIIKYIIYVITW